MIHEGTHVSVDPYIKSYHRYDWYTAVKNDGLYVSNYARDNPLDESWGPEDMAETYLVWLALN